MDIVLVRSCMLLYKQTDTNNTKNFVYSIYEYAYVQFLLDVSVLLTHNNVSVNCMCVGVCVYTL